MRQLGLTCASLGLLLAIALLGLGGLALVSHARAEQAPATGLTIEEHAIVEADVDTPEHFDYLARISADVRNLRRPWREAPRQPAASDATEGWWQTQRRGLLTRLGRRLDDGCHPGRAGRCRWVMGLHLLEDEPLVFVRWRGQVRLWHRGAMLPVAYDDVIHGRCCEPAAFNVAGNGSMVWFHALRGGTWYYVEVGAYGEDGGEVFKRPF